MTLRRLAFTGALLLAALVRPAAAADLTVSAASSLADALRELAPRFEAAHPGTRVLLNSAASDALLAQIAQGAPADVFASADEATMDRAQAQRLVDAATRQDIAANTLVAVVPSERGLALAAPADLAAPRVQRIALGQPGGVPAGRYARDALQAAGVWPAVEPKAVYAQNVRQALDYAARGEVDVAVVYGSDARSQARRVKVAFALPATRPILYPVAVVAGSAQAPLARRFVGFLRTPEAQAVLARHGFLRP